ncbi:MAG: MltR family transcriptional regulator [Ectopseudomonas guguanensis]|uniref:MltR family transcriptional regulator n=1 Tax=Ectopseudomonas guguanensis TaxID=1198456 RepID=UPI00391AF100
MSKGIAYESDRGCIIVAAALLDKQLEDSIRKHIKRFSVSKSLEKSLFDLSGPISNFSAKISICRSFGLIDEIAYKDLMILRKLRNSFAHEAEGASFTSASVRQKVKSMHFVQHCMKELEIDRYNYTEKPKEENKDDTDKKHHPKMLEEWKTLADGFLNYDKVMFCFAVDELEYHIKHYSNLGIPPPKTLSQGIKEIKKSKSQTAKD